MIESVVNEVIPSEKLRKELFKKVSEKTGVPLEVVETIINFQFEDVRRMTGELAYIEITKLCKLVITQPKLEKIIIQYADKVQRIEKELAERTDLDEKQRARIGLDLKFFTDNLAYMKTKRRDTSPDGKALRGKARKLRYEHTKQLQELQQETDEDAF